ncbi:MAG: dockerin type I repeat-containing protein [Clostridia bacterium]|nr:dockerin type I repeat-containing protein [Clostridia bacterium]
MKKVISLLLAVIMVCSVFYSLPVTAFAKEVDIAQSASSKPVISVESVKLNPYMGGYGEIVLKVTGATNVTYQWQAGYYDSALAPVDLDDNEYYIGTKTNHFKILASGQLDTLEFRCKITYDGGSTYSQLFHFTFLDPKVISRAYVVGVDAPAFGCVPKYRTDDIQSEQYDLDRMVWYGPINDSSAPLMESTDVYVEGKYKCRFYLDPAEGYTFNENSDCSVDGIICKVYSEKRDDGTTAYYADRVYTVAYKGTVPDGILDFEWRIPYATNPNVNLGDAYLDTDSMDIPFAFEIKDLPRSMALAGYTAYGTTYIRCDGEIVYSANSGDSVNLKDVATIPGRYYIYQELFLLDPEENQIDTGFVRYVVDVWTPIRIMNLSVEVDEPVAGHYAEIAFKNQTAGCVVNNMYWYDITDGERVLLKETDTFEAGRTYQVEMWLKANDGFYMNTDKEGCLNVDARINSKPAEVLLAYSSEKVAGFTMDFTIPGDSTNPSNPTDTTEPSTGGEDKPTDTTDPVVLGLLGDANEDGKVNIKDATLIQKHIAGLITLTDEGCILADVDDSDVVNIKDATAIQKHIAGIETGFPIGEPIA